MKPWIAVPAAAALALPLTACSTGSAGTDSGAIPVVAEMYAYAWVAEQVGGEHVAVSTLVPEGSDVHTFEVSPKQVTELNQAALVVMTSGAAHAVDDSLGDVTGTVVDASTLVDLVPADPSDHDEGEEHSFDPHTWLSISQLPRVVDAVAQALGTIDPDNAATYTANAEDLDARLADLDATYRTGLASCERTTFVITHPAFGYVARDYGLDQVGISGLEEDTEPSPERVDAVATIAEETGATTIFMADTSSPKVADVLASELGLKTAVLSSLISGEGSDYITIAEKNLQALQAGLGCS